MVYIGIMLLISVRNVWFIYYEVFGIKLLEDILECMDVMGNDWICGEVEGFVIVKNLIDIVYELFDGIYLIMLFMCYEMIEILICYIYDK